MSNEELSAEARAELTPLDNRVATPLNYAKEIVNSLMFFIKGHNKLKK